MANKEEQQIQMGMIKWFYYTHPKRKIFAVVNNSFGSKISNVRMGAINRKMGVHAGVSDLVLPVPNGTVYIEVKTAKGTQSKDQKEFQAYLKKLHNQYFIVRNLDEFILVVSQFFK